MQPATPTVFVVDDDEGVRNSLRFLLRSVGLATRALGSAQEFLEAYKQNQPGCLVLDVRMPGMSGIELQQQLNLRGATLPVIFITGHGDIPMAVEAMQHGAFDFLQKPFRDQDLIDRIQRALERDARNRSALTQHARKVARWAIGATCRMARASISSCRRNLDKPHAATHTDRVCRG